MPNLSLTPLFCLVVPTILILLFALACVPAAAQVHSNAIRPIDSGHTQIRIPSTDSLKKRYTIAADSVKSIPSRFVSGIRAALRSISGTVLSNKKKFSGDSALLRSVKNRLRLPLPPRLIPASDSTSGYAFKNYNADSLRGRLVRKMVSQTGYQKPVLLFQKPWVAINGGYVNYNFDFQSNIDTPFTERNIAQHSLSGSINSTVAGILPLTINFWARRSNSNFYQNITDVQLAFNPQQFRNNLIENWRKKMRGLIPGVEDSLLRQLYALKLLDLKGMKDWLNGVENFQKIRDCREIIALDGAQRSGSGSDSVLNREKDSLLLMARSFVVLYDSTAKAYAAVSQQVDSLEGQIVQLNNRIQRFRELGKGEFNGWYSYDKWRKKVSQYSPEAAIENSKYSWLLGIRNFNLGKSPVNSSELTAKNITVNGINFEYNTWYYLAVSAGLIDYRFRGFLANRQNNPMQYMYNIRAGLGRLEKNYFILSYFGGQKQLFSSTRAAGGTGSISLSGISLETKWQLNRSTYLLAEVAESMAPDFRSNPPTKKTGLSLSDNTNKAVVFKVATYLPATGTRLEGSYKYTGANYQSFSSFQTNAALKTWNIRFDQTFFKRKLRVNAVLRSNEFSNPYIIQNYRANTVFKSVNLTFKTRKWPTITFGYVPMSQFTVINQLVYENRFQTLTGTVNHFYKIGQRQAATTLVINKFYNSGTDSGFIYFNALNVYATQNVMFGRFTANVSISISKNSQYNLRAMECGIRVPLKRSFVGAGVKINNLNQSQTKVGKYVSTGLRITGRDMIYASYEDGYLPGIGGQLVNNGRGSIQYSRSF